MDTIYFGSDYNGAGQAAELKKRLATFGRVLDVVEEDPTLDSYIKIALRVAKRVASEERSIGIIVCGTGTGSCILANKVKGAYAVNCLVPQTAVYAKIINNANIMCLAGWGDPERNLEIVDTFFAAHYGNRKPERMAQIKQEEESLFPKDAV